MARIHNCGHRGCRVKLPMSVRYCDQHKSLHKPQDKQYYKQYNSTQRDQEANTFYQSKQWGNMRSYIYARDMGMCQITGQPILNTGRYITDHVHPLSIAPEERLDSNNLWLLSIEAHNVKTMIEKQLLNSPNGKNKAKHVSKDWYRKQVLSYMAKKRNTHND